MLCSSTNDHIRITSYNVCYTKLLRATQEAATDDATATEETGEATEEAATEDAAAEETGEVEPEAVTTVGDANGTHMEMWSFVELHNTYYGKMVDMWNAANPDRTIEVTFTTYPYADMHT